MKKILLWTIFIVILAGIGFFVWRMVFFYQAIKKGETIDLGGTHFSVSKNSGSGSIQAGVNVDSKKAPQVGKTDAKIKIVEFLDFTCPYSKEAFPIMRELLSKYPDKINWEVRFFPLDDEAHAGGREAAAASLCALSQGKFWPFHDRLFLNQKNFTNEDLINFAAQGGLNQEQFQTCIATKIVDGWINEDLKAGIVAGVRGTPTFFVNGNKIEGPIPLAGWEKALNLK